MMCRNSKEAFPWFAVRYQRVVEVLLSASARARSLKVPPASARRYFAREALIDTLSDWPESDFLSASRARATCFATTSRHVCQRLRSVTLAGEHPICIAQWRHVPISGRHQAARPPRATTAICADEYFWTHNFTELNNGSQRRDASCKMAHHAYFSTPSSHSPTRPIRLWGWLLPLNIDSRLTFRAALAHGAEVRTGSGDISSRWKTPSAVAICSILQTCETARVRDVFNNLCHVPVCG